MIFLRLPRLVWFAFFAHASVILIAVILADYLPLHPPLGFINPVLDAAPPLIEKFVRWDAHWYTYVAAAGYTEQSIVFFPLIIILIRTANLLGLSFTVAGFIVCNLFAGLTFWLLYITLRLDYSPRLAQRAVLLYGLMPTAFFINSIYTEPIFITFALACVYCTRSRHTWLAGIFAALAALTRNLGIFLVIFMGIELMSYYWPIHRHWRCYLPLLLPIGAVAGFMYYNYLLVGDPLSFIKAQAGWGREFGWPWLNIWHNLDLNFTFTADFQPGMYLDTILTLIAIAALLLATFTPKYQLRPSYLVWNKGNSLWD
jgi:Gpi18-like mannosyltransferase